VVVQHRDGGKPPTTLRSPKIGPEQGPMGLALENFDGAGRYRETENGAVLDISGELDGAVYDDVPGLARAMRNHPKLPYCLVNRLYAYGTGGPVSLRYDRDILAHFLEQFAAHGYKVPDLLREITLSAAFSKVRAAAAETVTDANITSPSRLARNLP
jgi:hypothetical protein